MEPLKCKICGSDLINDYRAGVSRCGHCCKEWPLSETDSSFEEYSQILGHINGADDILSVQDAGLKQLSEAITLYKRALWSCRRAKQGAAVNEISRICTEALAQCDKRRAYLKAKERLENKDYSQAMQQLSQLEGFDDLPQLIKQCRQGLEEERRKRIPYSIAVGLILPAILFFFLWEKTDIGRVQLAFIFITAAAADIFVIYLNNGFSTAVEIISFILLVPLLLFLLLVYILRIAAAMAVLLAVGLPIALIVIIGILGNKG